MLYDETERQSLYSSFCVTHVIFGVKLLAIGDRSRRPSTWMLRIDRVQNRLAADRLL